MEEGGLWEDRNAEKMRRARACTVTVEVGVVTWVALRIGYGRLLDAVVSMGGSWCCKWSPSTA
jgi:hypothetical protein